MTAYWLLFKQSDPVSTADFQYDLWTLSINISLGLGRNIDVQAPFWFAGSETGCVAQQPMLLQTSFPWFRCLPVWEPPLPNCMRMVRSTRAPQWMCVWKYARTHTHVQACVCVHTHTIRPQSKETILKELQTRGWGWETNAESSCPLVPKAANNVCS